MKSVLNDRFKPPDKSQHCLNSTQRLRNGKTGRARHTPTHTRKMLVQQGDAVKSGGDQNGQVQNGHAHIGHVHNGHIQNGRIIKWP